MEKKNTINFIRKYFYKGSDTDFWRRNSSLFSSEFLPQFLVFILSLS